MILKQKRFRATHSLRSKRFQSSYGAKVRAGTKKKRWKGKGRRGNACGQAFPSFPSPLLPFFFALVPTFLDELERKRLLRRLSDARQPEVRLSPFLYAFMLTNLYC